METVLVVILGLVALGLLSWFAWISIQSLFQASVLRRAIGHAGPAEDQPTAVYGPVQVDRPVQASGLGGNLLYCRITHQERVRSGKNSFWRTIGEEEEMATFTVDGIRVAGTITEIHGLASRTEYEGGGCVGGGFFSRPTRTLYRYLPIPDRATVLGRLENDVISKDNKVGLLISPKPPSRVATMETVKGIAGLVVVTAAIIFGIWLYYEIR